MAISKARKRWRMSDADRARDDESRMSTLG